MPRSLLSKTMFTPVLKRTIRCRRVFLFSAFLGLAATALAADEQTVLADVVYKQDAALAPGEAEPCSLDLTLPGKGTGYPSILWLHGGGLTGGSRKTAVSRRVAERLASAGIAVAMADYRLNPNVTFPAYIDDVAAAFAWLKNNIARHGGDPEKVFIGGHSAGAYLALMVALDGRYLTAAGLDESGLAGVVALSSQTTTHFTVRAERRPGDDRMIVDDGAPLFHVSRRGFPFLILYAGNDMALRVEENRLLAGALRHAGCETVIDHLYADRDHGTIVSWMDRPDDAVAKDVIQFLHSR